MGQELRKFVVSIICIMFSRVIFGLNAHRRCSILLSSDCLLSYAMDNSLLLNPNKCKVV